MRTLFGIITTVCWGFALFNILDQNREAAIFFGVLAIQTYLFSKEGD